MTTETSRENRFVPRVLPWGLAAALLALYLVTLGRGITLNNLQPFAQVSGLQWQPVLTHPLYFLVTLPLKLLPSGWLPLGLNLFSAGCAVLVLALLARAVALLPHDRTRRQRELERSDYSLLTIRLAWVPVVFAVLVCGLQYTFWQSAIGGGPELLSVLLFAYVVRNLLEYRRDGRETWLYLAVLAYAAALPENWLLVLLLPGFIVALIWFMGFGFFRLRFLARAWVLALLGISLYLLLPLLGLLRDQAAVQFWPALKFALADQKNNLVLHWQHAQDRLLVAALPSLLPLLVIGLRFKASSGDTSRLGILLTTFLFNVLHAGFLVFCAWVALDPPFSASQFGLGPSFLILHFLAALGVGYFSGYFLLLFSERVKVRGPSRALKKRIHQAVVAAVCLFAVLIVAGLVYRNLPLVRAADGRWLRQYASALLQPLPDQPAVLLSDDPRRLYLAQAQFATRKNHPSHLPVETRLLQAADYHRLLNQRSGGFWPLPPTNQPVQVDTFTIINRLRTQAAERNVYYLHPSFGYYFEFLYPEPHGLVNRLLPYATNATLAPLLSATQVQSNLDFWKQFTEDNLPALQRAIEQPAGKSRTNFVDRLLAKLRVQPGANTEAAYVAALYSRSANTWGVELQRLDRLREAGEMFALAHRLNPLNVVAQVNEEFNRNLVAGHATAVQITASIEDQFGVYRNWDQVIGENGFFDEPTFCYEQGRVFAQQSLYRQALQQFERTRALSPNDLPSRLWLANIYLITRLPDRVLEVVKEIKSQPERFALTFPQRTDLLSFEALAHFGRGEPETARQLLHTAVTRDPTNYHLLTVSAQVYLNAGDYTNALKVFDRQLGLRPADPDVLMNKGYACLQAGAFADAVPVLTQLLDLQSTNHFARFNRALAQLQSGQLDGARADYQQLLELYPNTYQVHYGLAEVAWRQHHTNDALQYYALYLQHAPTNTAEARLVRERVRQLNPSAP